MNTKKRTAGGCGVLIGAIFVLVGCGFIEDLYHPGNDDPADGGVAYDTTKLNGEYTVVGNPGAGTAGAGNIYYNGATRQLYLGTDAAHTLNAALDADLIAELWVCDPMNTVIVFGNKVTYTAGVLSLITFMNNNQTDDLALNPLLSRANIKIGASCSYTVNKGVITLPPGRTITLESGGASPAYFSIMGGHPANPTGAKIITGATGGADIIPTDLVYLVATGSATTFVSSTDTSNLTATAAPVKSFKASDYVDPASGYWVFFESGPAQDGVISAASTFRDPL
jgi:hypothetical protein